MKVLITGADGFIGTQLSRLLTENGYHVYAQVMDEKSAHFLKEAAEKGISTVISGDLTLLAGLESLVKGMDCVVHLAAKVHHIGGAGLENIASYRKVNTELTEKLATQAKEAGVKKFVFLSTVKVHGEITGRGKLFKETDELKPQDAYAQSKYEAEGILRAIAQDGGMEVTVIRSPLVYGPGVKANFLRLIKLVDKGIPLPFGKCSNLRSLIFVGNLTDIIKKCLAVPPAAATFQPFLVSDGEDLSTAQLVKLIAQSLGRKAKIVSIPTSLLEGAAAVVGYKEEVTKLTAALQIDTQKVKSLLQWSSPYTVAEGVRKTVEWYHHHTD